MEEIVAGVGNENEQIGCKKSIKSTSRLFAALLSGYLLMFVGGLHIGWSIFNPQMKAESWTEYVTEETVKLVISSYYVGVLLGLLGGRLLFRTVSKTIIYRTSAVLNACTGFMLVSGTTETQIMYVRVIVGFAIGLAHLNLIMQCEILAKRSRGILLSFCHFFTYLGVYAAIITVYIIGDEMLSTSDSKLRIIRYIVFAVTIIAFLCTFKIIREFPTYLLIQENFEAFLVRLLDLRNETEVTHEIELEFNELKVMVQEDGKLSQSIFTDGNMRPLLIISLAATVSVLSFNNPINTIRLNSLSNIEDKLIVFIVILVTIRLIFGIIACNLCDVVGRKKIHLISGCSSGVILVALGIITSMELEMSPTVSIIIFSLYEICITLGLNSLATVLMFEAFPQTKRPNSVATILALENCLHLILIWITIDLDASSEYFLYSFGSLLIVLSVLLQFILPETKGLTLRQARDDFRKQK